MPIIIQSLKKWKSQKTLAKQIKLLYDTYARTVPGSKIPSQGLTSFKGLFEKPCQPDTSETLNCYTKRKAGQEGCAVIKIGRKRGSI